MSTFIVSANTQLLEQFKLFLISNFRRVLNVLFFHFRNSPAFQFYMPTFRNTLSIPPVVLSFGWFPASEFYVTTFRNTLSVPHMMMEQSVPKRRHIIFRRRAPPKRKNTTFKVEFAVTINTDNDGQTVPKFPWKASICPTLHLACESSRNCSSVDCAPPCGTALNALSLPSFLGNKGLNWHQPHHYVTLSFQMCAINGNDSVGFTAATLNL